jgi:hypothetical protein
MDKLRDLMRLRDDPLAQRPFQQPSDLSVERQRLFAQQEARLWELRKARLNARDGPASSTARTYDVVRHKGAWRILYLGKHSQACPSQQAAVAAAVEKARADAALGRAVRVRLVRVDGRVWLVDLATGAPVDPSGGVTAHEDKRV